MTFRMWLRWPAAKMRLRVIAYGLTHSRCKRCRKHKGLNLYSHCAGCQLRNLKEALEFEDEEWSDILRGLAERQAKGEQR